MPKESLIGVPGSWRCKANVVDTHSIWAEVDFKDHPDIPPEEIRRRVMEEARPKPSAVVSSGHGVHVYWTLRGREDASRGRGQQRIEEMLTLACQHVGGDPHVAEVARLMRLPGSRNTRIPGEDLPVTFEVVEPHAYTLEELENAWLEAAPILPAPVKKDERPKANRQDFAWEGPLEADSELEAMRFQGADGAPTIHYTQLRVAAKLTSEGRPVAEIVGRILAATKKAVEGVEAARGWDWAEEEQSIARMCFDWVNKRMKEDGEDLSHCLPDKLYDGWQKVSARRERPVVTFNRFGACVRGFAWEPKPKSAGAAAMGEAPVVDGNVVRLVSSQEKPQEEAHREQGQEEEQRQESSRRRPVMFSSFDFTAGFVPPDYVVVGVLQRRFLYSCTGATGDGKTTWLLLLAAHVGRGLPLGSHECKKGHVVVLAGENPDDVRMRWIAMAEHLKFDPRTIDVHFVPGVFPIKAIKAMIEKKAEELGCQFALVIVDTSAAYFTGSEENSNAQVGAHARTLRSLVEVPGGPCVVVSCHPTKNADRDNLLPRGGGAYVAEVDGNLICRKAGGDNVSEVHWHGKFRGPDFNPLTFETRQVTTAKLVDSDGQPIPTVVGFPLDETAHSSKRAESRAQEDDLLLLLAEQDGMSLALMAHAAGWISKTGEPYKSKAQRVVERLRTAGLVKNERGDWQLTDAGRKAANRAGARREASKPRWTDT
jgi:hypothetical protein